MSILALLLLLWLLPTLIFMSVAMLAVPAVLARHGMRHAPLPGPNGDTLMRAGEGAR